MLVNKWTNSLGGQTITNLTIHKLCDDLPILIPQQAVRDNMDALQVIGQCQVACPRVTIACLTYVRIGIVCRIKMFKLDQNRHSANTRLQCGYATANTRCPQAVIREHFVCKI